MLKLIEANVRFTGCNGVVAEAGIDLAAYVYARLTGSQHQFPPRFREGKRLWNPRRDLQSALALRRRGELTLFAWVRSLRPAQMFFTTLDDPMPGLGGVVESGRRLLRVARRRRAPAAG